MSRPAGMILAGGLSRRMGGGDKTLRPLAGISLLDRVIDRLRPQVEPLALNANGDPARFAGFGLPVVPDTLPGHLGPLAGLLAALLWSRDLGAAWCLTCAGDIPMLPADLGQRLAAGLGAAPCAVAASGGRVHPVCGLWSVDLAEAVAAALAGNRLGIWKFAESQGAAVLDWPTQPLDPFANINEPQDLQRLEAALTPR